jgi:hypothetical protein
MATNATQSPQANRNTAVSATLAKERMSEGSSAHEKSAKPTGYGLPCSKCHLYYPANLDVCPTCKHEERVSPVAPQIPPRVAQAPMEQVPDSSVIEREREEFLRQFKSQLMEAHAEVANAPETVCKFAEHHAGKVPVADICHSCYERLQERVDILEATLHMDLKEATQIIYDAVWSDPSDPSKTYQNAASAIMSELRKRAGVTTVLGPFQTLTH